MSQIRSSAIKVPAGAPPVKARATHHTFKRTNYSYVVIRAPFAPEDAPEEVCAPTDVWWHIRRGHRDRPFVCTQYGWVPAKQGMRHPVLQGMSLQKGLWKTLSAARSRRMRERRKWFPDAKDSEEREVLALLYPELAKKLTGACTESEQQDTESLSEMTELESDFEFTKEETPVKSSTPRRNSERQARNTKTNVRATNIE